MLYNDIFDLTDSLCRKLHRFAGRRVYFGGSVHMFREVMTGCDYLKRERCARSLNYDGEVLIEGSLYPVTVTISGANPYEQMECNISINH